MEKEAVGLKNEIENITFSIEQLSVKQLVDLSVDFSEDQCKGLELRNELIKRGKDNIQTRIQIKKVCRDSVSNIEVLLQKTINENHSNKETVKLCKSKFLHSVSVLDRLELEWQKYDLSIRK